jgi:S1-C subfamily serine protease
MASTHFLTNTKLSACRPVRHSGELITSENNFQLLKSAGKRDKFNPGKLLAEPALGSESDGQFRDATWFSAFEGDPQRFSELQGGARERAEENLREQLAALEPALADPALGPVLGRALLIPSLDDVYVVDGNPVLSNWGLVPAEVEENDEALAEHFASTLGGYCDYTSPWLLSGTALEESTDEAAAGRSIPGAALGGAGNGGGGEPPVAAARGGDRPWYVSSGFIAFYLSLLLAVGVLLGWVLHPTVEVVVLPEGVGQAELQRGINDNLLAEINRIEVLMQGDVCGVESEDYLNPVIRDTTPRAGDISPEDEGGGKPAGDAPSGAPAEEGTTPEEVAEKESSPEEAAEGEGPPEEPVGEDDATEGPETGQVVGSRATVREALEESVVLVVVDRGPDGGGTGSGFFITPDTIVTNRHVIGKGTPRGILVASQSLGRVIKADLVIATQGQEIGERDYAVLKIAEPAGVSLRLAPDVEKLSRIYVGGFPGYFTQFDPRMKRLLQGDPTATPEMAMSLGDVILVRPPIGNEVSLVIHTADVRPGNSGGPLIDGCGQVVGINTFISQDDQSNRTTSWSLHSADLAAFLTEKQISFESGRDACPQ